MEDTIAAISSALGVGAISIIRISGDKSLDIINKIFDKYVRLSKAKQITSGSGIGLWIVKRVAEIYDLGIDVNSTDHSVTFSLKFKHIDQKTK